MREITIGIDIGTSYTKAASRSEDGRTLATFRCPSPAILPSEGLIHSFRWWLCMKEGIQNLLAHPSSKQCRIAGICVSAITPTLTIFDSADPRRARSIFYSSPAKNGNVPSNAHINAYGDATSQRDLTAQRALILKEIANTERYICPLMTDLVGYLNWCLSETLTVNALCLAEMGLGGIEGDYELLTTGDEITARPVSVGEQIGEVTRQCSSELDIDPGASVCGGCPDTLGSIIGCGLNHQNESMLYLGTFGSLLSLDVDVDVILNAVHLSAPPYHWLLSVPNFGPTIERLGLEWFGADSSHESHLKELDLAATRSSAGACGSLFLLPRWQAGITRIGDFHFEPGRDGALGDITRRSRAVLESIGYASLIISGRIMSTLRVSGGGAQSRPWTSIIAGVLGCDVLVQNLCWEATGTADLAARLVRHEKAVRESLASPVESRVDTGAIFDNLQRLRKLYQSEGWI